jgi:uncharacterized membrane protein YgdD (TMEM256/DUF423 family)
LEQLTVSPRAWIVLAASLGGLSVALGAFGAHALPGALASQNLDASEMTRRLANWETAARYHMYHALALLAVGWLASRGGGVSANVAGWCFVVGVAIFSGCLYALVLSGMKFLGAIVPIGGVLLIVGWLALAVAGWKSST